MNLLSRICQITALLLITTLAVATTSKNGFDLSDTLVAKDEILLGDPRRDGIPAIDKPKFVPGKQVGFLNPDDRVLGLINNKQAKAYPIAILNYHEIVNDNIGGERTAVTYCPLCGSGIAYRSEVRDRALNFASLGSYTTAHYYFTIDRLSHFGHKF